MPKKTKLQYTLLHFKFRFSFESISSKTFCTHSHAAKMWEKKGHQLQISFHQFCINKLCKPNEKKIKISVAQIDYAVGTKTEKLHMMAHVTQRISWKFQIILRFKFKIKGKITISFYLAPALSPSLWLACYHHHSFNWRTVDMDDTFFMPFPNALYISHTCACTCVCAQMN